MDVFLISMTSRGYSVNYIFLVLDVLMILLHLYMYTYVESVPTNKEVICPDV